jgi:stage V sporulation protein B
MERDNFFKNSFILTASNLTTGILGFMFSIILSRELGPEGMGLYGLVMPIYNLFICLICGGIITAVSKISAEFLGNNDYKNLRKTIKTTLVFNVIWSIIVVSFVYIFSVQIATYIIKDPRTLYSLRLTCPAMIFIAISNTLKGYFYGTSNISIPAFIDISEKAVRIAVIFILVTNLKLNTVTETVTAGYVALCIGEFISLILLYIYYRLDTKKHPYSMLKSEGRAQLIFNILVISLPLCINGFVSTILSTISTLIVPRRLISSGLTHSEALSMIGKFTGMSLNIVFFPMIVIGSISTVLIPDLSQNISKKDFYTVELRIAQVLRIAYLLGLSTLVICLCIPNDLGFLFFKRTDLGSYIKFAALSAPIFYVSATTFGILNGLGRQNIILTNSLIVSVLEVILLFILTAIPKINIYGYGISFIITSVLTLMLNMHEIKKYIEILISPINIFIDSLTAILIYYLISTISKIIPNTMFVTKNITVIVSGFLLMFLFSSFFKKRSV